MDPEMPPPAGRAAALVELDDPRRGRLVIRGGETVVLLGPSGAGKTALIRTLLGLEGTGPEPVLAVRGRPAAPRQLAALVGWVPEGDGVFLSDTVWDNVARPPSAPPHDPDLARDALDLVGLAARAAEPVEQPAPAGPAPGGPRPCSRLPPSPAGGRRRAGSRPLGAVSGVD